VRQRHSCAAIRLERPSSLLAKTTFTECWTKADPARLVCTHPPVIPNTSRFDITNSILIDVPYSNCVDKYLSRRGAEISCRQVQPC